jgi:hypothetical protein
MRRVVAFLVALALLAGCGASLSDSITDSVWKAGDGRLIDFRSDGTYSVGFTVPEEVADADSEWGTWSLDGDVLTMTPNAESSYCPEITGIYTVAIGETGELEATPVEDKCAARASQFPFGLTPQPDTTP